MLGLIFVIWRVQSILLICYGRSGVDRSMYESGFTSSSKICWFNINNGI
jgi:hypothetical protein